MRRVLDTSVLLATDVPRLDGELAISTASLAELHVGVQLARDDRVRAERLRRLVAIERRFDALPIDEAVAASYGTLAAAVVRHGRQPRGRASALLIAATAHAHGALLCTRDAEDLRGLADLLDVAVV